MSHLTHLNSNKATSCCNPASFIINIFVINERARITFLSIMKTFAAKVLFAILVVLVPFTVIGLETSKEDGGLVPTIAIGDEIMKEGSRQNLRVTMSASSSKTIVELAVGAKPEFETLVAAVTAADLVDALSGAGPFTVFGELVIALILSRFDFNFFQKHQVIISAHTFPFIQLQPTLPLQLFQPEHLALC